MSKIRLFHPMWEEEGRLFDKAHAEAILATPNTKIYSKDAGKVRDKKDSKQEEE